jgi:hypothetical protein
MVKVPGYPDIALDDVWRSKAKFDEDYSTRTTDIVTPAMLANKEVVLKLTIDQKIDFWRRVMQYAHERNIEFYVITWNVYTYGTEGKYGITDALDNPKTIDYFRASVRALFRTYPLLAGIGVTAGENMGDASAYYQGGTDSFDAKEDWLMATYGQGVLDARAASRSANSASFTASTNRARRTSRDLPAGDRAAQRRFRVQLQVRAGARLVVDDADLPPRLPGVAGQPAAPVDHPQ